MYVNNPVIRDTVGQAHVRASLFQALHNRQVVTFCRWRCIGNSVLPSSFLAFSFALALAFVRTGMAVRSRLLGQGCLAAVCSMAYLKAGRTLVHLILVLRAIRCTPSKLTRALLERGAEQHVRPVVRETSFRNSVRLWWACRGLLGCSAFLRASAWRAGLM